MNAQLISLKTIHAPLEGSLSFFESQKDIPFNVRRIYYIYDVPMGVRRGMHAHKALQQFLWCAWGKVDIILDSGREVQQYCLDSPQKGLLVGEGIWREMVWQKEGSVLCVAASEHYDEGDYIRDYRTFVSYVEKGYWDETDK